MKKILVLMLMSALSFQIFSQDIDLSTQTIKNTTQLSSYFPYFETGVSDTLVYRIQAEYLMPWTKSGTLIWPRSTSYNLLLGTTTEISGGTKLTVAGTSLFTDNINLSTTKSIYLGSARIYTTDPYGSGDLYFSSPTAGTKSLSELGTGSGEVGITGTTPAAYRVATWYDSTNIQASADFTFKPDDYFHAKLDLSGGVVVPSIYMRGDTVGVIYANSVGQSSFVGVADGKPMLRYYGGAIDAGIKVLATGKTVITGTDSIEIADNMYYTAAGTLKTAYGWLYADSADANKVLVDSSVVAPSYGLRGPMKNIFKYFFDRANGELYWYYQTDSLTIAEDPGVLFGHEPPGRTIEKLVVAIEHLYRRFFRLWLFVLILFGIVGYQHFQIKKLNKILNK